MGDSWRWPEILRPNEPKLIAEIGVYRGEGSARLLAEFPEATVYMIDPWKESPPKSAYRKTRDGCAKLTQDEHDANYVAALNATKFAQDRTRIIRMPSVEAASEICFPLCAAIIDGDHSYEAVKKDTEAYWPLIREGGMLCFHDFFHKRFGVTEAATEFAAATNRELHSIGSCAWIQR